MKKTAPKIRTLLFLVAVVAAGGLFWKFWMTEGDPEFNIQTAQLSMGNIERSISATGSVQALVTVDVSSQLSGQIAQVNVDFNSQVKKDDTLATIDPRTFASRVSSAESNLIIAKATVEVQQSNVTKAVALRDQARRAVERQKRLIATRATAEATLDQAQTQYETALADVEVAKAQLTNARASVSQKEAELAQARLDLDRTQLKTPIDGVVISRAIDPGSTVAASLQAPVLFQIAQDLKQIEILVLVDEADIGVVETGQDVSFTVDAFPDRVFDGKVSQIRIAGTTTNNVVTYTVVVSAENPKQRLLPGMTATVRIVTGVRENVLRVPNDAVRFTPPKELPVTARVDRTDRDAAIVAAMSERLKLSEEQKERFRTALADQRAGRSLNTGNAAGAGAERAPSSSEGGEGPTSQLQVGAERRQSGQRRSSSRSSDGQRRGRVGRALSGILTEPQQEQFKQLRESWRENTRPAVVWRETPRGLQPNRLILGLTDDTYSEVMRGNLKDGETVVVRARLAGAEGASRGGGRSR
ncbi:MAG: efflux RND transporter periplasmic adaptor subunit [Hyphomicrobiaceae bacterium]